MWFLATKTQRASEWRRTTRRGSICEGDGPTLEEAKTEGGRERKREEEETKEKER